MSASASFGHRSALRAVITAALVVIATLATIAAGAIGMFEQDLNPDLQRKAVTVATVIAGELEHAAQLGIPIAHLPGVDQL